MIAFKDQMSKAEFAERLKYRFGETGLTEKAHTKPQRKTLYYMNGTHVGTWRSGLCWAFSVPELEITY